MINSNLFSYRELPDSIKSYATESMEGHLGQIKSGWSNRVIQYYIENLRMIGFNITNNSLDFEAVLYVSEPNTVAKDHERTIMTESYFGDNDMANMLDSVSSSMLNLLSGIANKCGVEKEAVTYRVKIKPVMAEDGRLQGFEPSVVAKINNASMTDAQRDSCKGLGDVLIDTCNLIAFRMASEIDEFKIEDNKNAFVMKAMMEGRLVKFRRSGELVI